MVQSLPMEVLEEIVGFYKEGVGGKPSTTLLSCLSTSRQFRVCALRLMCEEISFPLDRPHRLEQLRDCIVPGGFGPFIKSIIITCWSRPRHSPYQFDEDTVVPLLKTLSSRISVRRLSLRGYRPYGYSDSPSFTWTCLPDQTRQSLLCLSHISTIDYISLSGLRDFPPEILARHASKVIILQSSQADSEILPECPLNITSMTLHHARLRKFRLPKLRSFDTSHNILDERDSGWRIIRECCNTLEIIQISDSEKYGSSIPIQLPPDISINMFPKLQEFVYSYRGFAWDEMEQLLFKVLPFFNTPEVAPQFRVLKLDLSLDGTPTGIADDFWVGRSGTVATDPSWEELDAILANGRFPALEKVSISLSFRISFLAELESDVDDFVFVRVADKDALKREVEEGLTKSFSASFKASIPLEIVVRMDF